MEPPGTLQSDCGTTGHTAIGPQNRQATARALWCGIGDCKTIVIWQFTTLLSTLFHFNYKSCSSIMSKTFGHRQSKETRKCKYCKRPFSSKGIAAHQKACSQALKALAEQKEIQELSSRLQREHAQGELYALILKKLLQLSNKAWQAARLSQLEQQGSPSRRKGTCMY